MKSGRVVVARVLESRNIPTPTTAGLQGGRGRGRAANDRLRGAQRRAGHDRGLRAGGGRAAGGMTIKRSRIRGQESQGMLCAPDELGLGTDHDGIMALPDTYAWVRPSTT